MKNLLPSSRRNIPKNPISSYVRVLAYNGIAVAGNDDYPGSERIICPAEMFRHGIKNPQLMEYSLQIVSEIMVSETLSNEIVRVLCENVKIPELIKFYTVAKFQGNIFIDERSWELLLYLGASKLQLLELITAVTASKITEKSKNFTITQLREIIFLQEYMTTDIKPVVGENHNDIEQILVVAILQKKTKLVAELESFFARINPRHKTPMVRAYILQENLDALENLGTLKLGDIPLDILALSDSVPIYDFLLRNLPEDSKKSFIYGTLSRANYDSKLFTLILERDFDPSDSCVGYLMDKTYMDFAGFATIFQKLNPDTKRNLKSYSKPQSYYRVVEELFENGS